MSHTLKRSHNALTQMGEDFQVDYSYDQWRQAQMRQLEHDYARMHQQHATAARPINAQAS